jgi:uroporphyrinogen decarboxylase
MAELTSMERVVLTLKGEPTDRVPVCSLAIGVTRQLTGVGFPEFSMNSELAAEAMRYANRIVGDDVFLCFTDLSVEAADFGQEIVYPTGTTAHPNYDKPLIREVDDYGRLPFFKAATGKRMSTNLDVCSHLLREDNGQHPVLGFVYGPLGVLGMMRGIKKLYMDILEYPDQVKKGLDIVTGVLIDFVKEQYNRGVIGICVDTLPCPHRARESPPRRGKNSKAAMRRESPGPSRNPGFSWRIKAADTPLISRRSGNGSIRLFFPLPIFPKGVPGSMF